MYHLISTQRDVNSFFINTQKIILIFIAVLITKGVLQYILINQKETRKPTESNAKQTYNQKNSLLSTFQQTYELIAKKCLFWSFNENNFASGIEQKMTSFSRQPSTTDSGFFIKKSLMNKQKTIFSNFWDILKFRLTVVKQQIQLKLASKIGQPGYGLITGMVFGSDDELDRSIRLNLKNIGMLHVVSASGYNIALLYSIVRQVFSLVKSKKINFLLTFFAIWLYVLISGSSISIVRAALTTSLYLVLRKIFFHRTSPLVLFFWIFSLSLIAQPGYLSNISFQLSFLASFGLIFCFLRMGDSVIIENVSFSGLPLSHTISAVLLDSFKTSLVAQVFVLPITIYHFGELSTVSLLANTFLLWLMPFLTIAGALLILIANWSLFDLISNILVLLLSAPIWLFEKISTVIGSLSFSLIRFDREIMIYEIFLYYLLMLIIINLYFSCPKKSSVVMVHCSKGMEKWRN